MELFEARDHYIIQNGEQALWCSRLDGSLTARRGEQLHMGSVSDTVTDTESDTRLRSRDLL